MTRTHRMLLAVVSSLVLISGMFFANGTASGASTKATTYAYIGSTRTGTSVYIGGLVHETGVSPVGRLAYLQRNLSGSWQNMVGRNVDSTGRMSVTFTQPYDLAYRWVLPETTTGLGATSATADVGGVPVSPPPTSKTFTNAFTTGYGWPDNSPAGNGTSGPSGVAGGTGTYANPITLAVGYVGSVPDFAYGTKFYVPNVRRYFVVGDTCQACHNLSAAPAGTSVWVDMWSGGNGSDNAGVLACEDSLTRNTTLIENPPANEPVVAGPLWSGTSCTAQFGP
jgi:hypothetical protein